MYEELSGRVGEFRIRDVVVCESPDAVIALLSRVLVVEARYDFVTRSICYTAYGRCFDVIPEGELPKKYSVSQHVSNRGTVDELWFSPYGKAEIRRDPT